MSSIGVCAAWVAQVLLTSNLLKSFSLQGISQPFQRMAPIRTMDPPLATATIGISVTWSRWRTAARPMISQQSRSQVWAHPRGWNPIKIRIKGTSQWRISNINLHWRVCNRCHLWRLGTSYNAFNLRRKAPQNSWWAQRCSHRLGGSRKWKGRVVWRSYWTKIMGWIWE